MRFPDSFLEEVRQRIDVVEVVSQYVPLKRAGKNFKGLCPFHGEKTPSFNVSPDRQIFHCFGCGEGGDAFKFVMLYERMSFVEAVAHLAARAGLSIPEQGGESKDRGERTLLLDIHEEAARFYQSQLRLKEGVKALEYLRQRGLSDETVSRFGFGFAPDGWSQLLSHLTGRGTKPELAQRAGLAVARNERPGFYDRFRARVMIPIRNESGRIVAFGGRLLGPGEPKYLNSPETPIYSKGHILFGFDRAKDAVRQRGYAILMEGYLDVIQAVQAGFEETVACCGTALTPAHARLLRRATDEIVVSFDPDVAGAAATRRSIDLLVEEGFRVSVLSLPAGDDPDLFIRHHGPDAFRSQLQQKLPFLDYLIRAASARYDLKTPRGKNLFLNDVLPTIARIPGDVERAAYVGPLAHHAEISDELVLGELRRQLLERRPKLALPAEGTERLTDAERDLVLWAFASPGETAAVVKEIEEEDLRGLKIEGILRAMRETAASSGTLSTDGVLSRLAGAADRSLFTGLAAKPDPVNPRQTPRDCLNSLRRERLKREIGRLQTEIERGGADDEHFARVWQEKLELKRRMEKLA